MLNIFKMQNEDIFWGIILEPVAVVVEPMSGFYFHKALPAFAPKLVFLCKARVAACIQISVAYNGADGDINQP